MNKIIVSLMTQFCFLIAISKSIYGQIDLINNGSFELTNSTTGFTGGWSEGGCNYNQLGPTQCAFVASPTGPVFTIPVSLSPNNTGSQTLIRPDPTFIEWGPHQPKSGSNFAVLFRSKTIDNFYFKPRIDYQLDSDLEEGKSYILKFSVVKARFSDRKVKLKIVVDDTQNNNLQFDRDKIFQKKIANDGYPNYDASSWDNYEVIFTARRSDLDVIKFEFYGTLPTGNKMVAYLDDVHLYEYCDYIGYNNQQASTSFCTLGSGSMWPTAGPTASNGMVFHNDDSPFYIENLENVVSAKIRVTDLGGSLVKEWSQFCKNGIWHRIYWDGKTNAGGECAAGVYNVEITCDNFKYPYGSVFEFCNNNIMTRTFTFPKLNGVAEPTIYVNNPTCESSVPLQYIPCCTYLNEIDLNNLNYLLGNYTYFGHDNVYEYQANRINFGPGNTIEDQVTVYLYYGNSCTLTPPFRNIGSGKFLARNLPCPPNRLAQISTQKDDFSVSNKVNLNDLNNLDSVFVYPNPINIESLRIFIRSLNQGVSSVTIVNQLGQTVIDKTVKLNEVNVLNLDIPKGLYILIIGSDDKTQRIPIVKI